MHPEEYGAYEKVVSDKASKAAPKQAKLVKVPASECQVRPNDKYNLESCLKRKVVSWASDSLEYQQRLSSVLDMLSDSCYPLNIVDRPSFKKMISTPQE